jgi:hypothetical protein
MAWRWGGTEVASWPAVCLKFSGRGPRDSFCERINGTPNPQIIGRGVQVGEP